MNKRGLVKYIFIFVATIISFYFLITSEVGFGLAWVLPMIFAFLYALTIFMFFNMNKIKKNKFIYDVILLLMMIFFIGCSIYIIYCDIKCSFDPSCGINFDANFTVLFSILLFDMLLFGFMDIFNKTNKVNDILTIVVSTLIILIHVRYYLDPSFMHKIAEGDVYLQYSYAYITQNYIYFIIMYIVVLLHRGVNKIS